MNSPVTPSNNPANYNTLSGCFTEVLNNFLNQTDDMLPAQVVSYNRATNRATVQPMIQMQATNGQIITRARIASVPVFTYGGGGFVIGFPLTAGAKGWIKANDRDISLYLAGGYVPSLPNTKRKHSFSDCVFIPDVMGSFTLAGEDANNLVIQNTAGTVKVSWWSNLLKIIAPNVGIGGTPASSAILDVQSTTKAFYPPRMTTTQKNAISSPAAGAVVYDTTAGGLSVYNGSIWS